MVTKSSEDDGTAKVDTGPQLPAPLEKAEEFVNGVVIIVYMVATTLFLGLFIAARRGSLARSAALRRKGWLLPEQTCVIVIAALAAFGAAVNAEEIGSGRSREPLKLANLLDKFHNPDNWFVAFAMSFLVYQGALQIGKWLVRKICPPGSADPGLLLAVTLVASSVYCFVGVIIANAGYEVMRGFWNVESDIRQARVVIFGCAWILSCACLVGRAGWQYARQLTPHPNGSKAVSRTAQKVGCAFAFLAECGICLLMIFGAMWLVQKFQTYQVEPAAPVVKPNLLKSESVGCKKTMVGLECLLTISTDYSKILLNPLTTVSVSSRYDFVTRAYTHYDLSKSEGAEILPMQPPPSGGFWSLENHQRGLMLIRLSASRSCPVLKSVLEKDAAPPFPSREASIRTLWSGFAVDSHDQVVSFNSVELVTQSLGRSLLLDMCDVKTVTPSPVPLFSTH